MASDWCKLPNAEVKDAIGELVKEVRSKINCPPEHEIEVYRMPKWPRASHLECKQCPRDVFVKSFRQDAGVSSEERQLRYDIERKNLEDLARKGLREGCFSNDSFHIPQLLGSIGDPHFALIEEYVGSQTLADVISNTIHNGKNDDLLKALSLLAQGLACLHDGTMTEMYQEDIPSVKDPLKLLNNLANSSEFGGVLPQLYSLHSKWVEDEFFKKTLRRCIAHDGLTPVNLLYSSDTNKSRISITDFETLHYDTPCADIGTVCTELKLSFMINADNSYLAEPYIGYFLREYFAHHKKLDLTYRQFTWVQAYFMGRRLLIIAQGGWLWSSLRRWCVDEVKSIWGLIDQKGAFFSPPFLRVKAVSFDFYNTLVLVEDKEDDLKNFERVRNYVAKKWPSAGADLASPGRLREEYFKVIQEMLQESREEYPDVDLELVWDKTFARLGIKIADLLFLHDRFRKRLREILKVFRRSAVRRFEVVEGAVETIKTLKAHDIRIGIISDAQLGYIESELERSGILPFIDYFLFSSEWRYRKPDRRFFEWVLERLAVRPEEAVFVGDDMFRDIFGAKRVGMRTIYKPSDYGQSFCEGCSPDEVVTDFRKLPEMFGILTPP